MVVEQRVAARALLLSAEGSVLLLWHSLPHDADHWAAPGGGLEVGESLLEALHRELVEEVGLTSVTLTGPVLQWRHAFSYHGRMVDQHETYFVARVPGWTPAGSPEHMAADGIAGWRWFSAAEVEASTDDIWPAGLAGLLRTFVA